MHVTEFVLHELKLQGTTYVPLPKLSNPQMKAIGSHLVKKGFKVDMSESLVARTKKSVLRVNPVGICWSRGDPADALYPLVPHLLSMPKVTVTVEELAALYFNIGRVTTDTFALRLTTRMESSNTWRYLRLAGESGLCPDEKLVASYFLEACGKRIPMFTDFPKKRSRSRIFASRQYYESFLTCAEAKETLRTVGQKGPRNSYLPQDGLLFLDSVCLPSRTRLVEVLHDLGDWCGLKAE